MVTRLASLMALLAVMVTGAAQAAESIRVASTTSTEASGLFAHILPKFKEATGIRVDVVAVGTGQAIKLAERGDADVLLVHHRPSEERFVSEGYGVQRHDVMYNDFVLVGPTDDPAGVGKAGDAAAAMKAIADTDAVFVSRADDSGTHKRELSLWQAAGVTPDPAQDEWYRAIGAGMGRTLNQAAAMRAYTLSDRGTWLSFNNKQDLAVVLEGDERLFNPYGVILVDAKKHPHVKSERGQEFIDWLTGPEGQAAIASFKIDGQQLFHPNAKRS